MERLGRFMNEIKHGQAFFEIVVREILNFFRFSNHFCFFIWGFRLILKYLLGQFGQILGFMALTIRQNLRITLSEI